MRLTRLYDQIVVISRLVAVTGDKLAMSTVTSVYGNLQPASNQQVQLSSGVYGQLYRFFCDGSVDINEGDEFKDERGVIYTVRKGGVTRWTHGVMDYLEILVDRKK